MQKGTTIVIGAGPGLGMAVARAFAAEGHSVALLSRDRERIERDAAELSEAGQTVKAYAADAGEAGNLTEALNRAIDELGPPEVLAYNAAGLLPGKPTELSTDEWNRRLAVNISGAKVATDLILPRLRDSHGSLLFTGGRLALRPSPDYTALSVGKAGLRAYALALFEDQRDNGVHAATVTIAGYIGQPGFEADAIAQRYIALHQQPRDEWVAEVVVD